MDHTGDQAADQRSEDQQRAGHQPRDHRAGEPAGEPAGGHSGRDTGAAREPAGRTGPDVEELRERWQRAVAELDNLRKRYDRQVAAARAAERDQVTTAWLPVLDHLELALQHAQADPAAIIAGVTAVRDQALAVMTGLGYRRVDEVGERFDPARHEAVTVVGDTDAEPNTVLAVLRAGYVTDTRLLRPAVVTVAGDSE